MPLTEAGEKIKREMKEEYGDKKGERVFYSKENADPKFRKLVTGSSKKAEGSIKEDRSQYPAAEEGWTQSLGPSSPPLDKLTSFSNLPREHASFRKSDLWWALRIARLPEVIKSRIMKSVKMRPAVSWWTERINNLNTNLQPTDVEKVPASAEDGEDHTRA